MTWRDRTRRCAAAIGAVVMIVIDKTNCRFEKKVTVHTFIPQVFFPAISH